MTFSEVFFVPYTPPYLFHWPEICLPWEKHRETRRKFLFSRDWAHHWKSISRMAWNIFQLLKEKWQRSQIEPSLKERTVHVREVSGNLQRLTIKAICTLKKIKPMPYTVWEIHALTPKSLRVLLIKLPDSHEKTLEMKIISSLLSLAVMFRSSISLLG